MSALILYDTAREALAEALRVDEVLSVRDQAERIRLYGRQARDRRIIADATELQLRAERKLGTMLRSAHEAGQLGYGRRKSNLSNGTEAEPFQDGEAPERVTLAEVGVDKKLSAKAQKWAALGEPEFEEKLAELREKIEAGGAVVINPLRDLSTADKKARRAAREAELGKKQAALPAAKFGVIYADPEWQFEVRSDGGLDRAADNHYPTSGLDVIKGRDVGALAAEDCVLFLWTTVPMLADAIDVLRGWGFAYKSNFAWHKDRIGTGYWNRNRHEHLLIGTRGAVPAPAMGTQFDSSIEAAVGAHSAKPEVFYEIIEAYFPTLPKIELNARQARKGWARWGLEAPGDVSGGDVSAESGLSQAKPRAEAPAGEAPAAHPSSGAARHLLPQGEKEEGGTAQDTETSAAPPGRGAGAVDAVPALAGEAAPPPSASPAPDINAVIRAGYARNAPLAEIAAATGLGRAAIKHRAGRMGLGDRARQRAAVSRRRRQQ